MKYQIIYADPPWQYSRNGKYCAGRYYETMTTEQIMALPVIDLSDKNCLLFLWTTNSFLHDAFHVIDAWGFEYKTCLTWKKQKFGLGYWLWGQTEHCLLAAKGKHDRMKPPVGTTILEAVAFGHSQKPDAMYSLIEKFPYEPRLELFAREQSPMFPKRDGWDVWGNQIKCDIEMPLSMAEVTS